MDPDKGRYSGPVIHVTDHHVVQDIGRGAAAIHDRRRLPPKEVEKAIADKKSSLTVEYRQQMVSAKARTSEKAQQVTR